MSHLEIYHEYGFKFFLCKADKSPDTPGNWKEPENHLTLEQARHYQTLGKMIGAWIPENMIVIDLDRHDGKPNGVKAMEGIKEKYNIKYSITDTFVVTTAGNGIHIFFTTGNNFRQNEKAPGVDLKTHKGYVIAAGSPGYNIFSEYEPQPLPFELEQWLLDCEKQPEKKTPPAKQPIGPKKYVPVKLLKRILNKIDPTHFQDNGRWIEFVTAIKAACGDNEDVYQVILEWSNSDPEYQGKERQTITRIESVKEEGGITKGTFVHYLREENLTQYMINQVVKLDTISNLIIDAENSEIDLPFPDPEYNELSKSAPAQEFFHTQGNTAGAALLETALRNLVLYSNSEKANFYFDGSRWVEFFDFYGIVYTIIYRTIKILYNETEGDKEDNDRMYKCVSAINNTHWKNQTWREFCSKEMIYKPYVLWDSPKIKETITTIDGVLDFTNGKIIERSGDFSEYRRDYFEFTSEEIINATTPDGFINFLNDLFLNKETFETAKYCVSMIISGNSGKRLFQMWQGIGSNGKSTLLETLKKVMGKKAYSFPPDLLLENTKKENFKPETADFQGKYFCYATETNKNSKLSQNLVKQFTGDDTLNARRLYQSPIEFEATWQIVYAVNDLPRFEGDDFAFTDRLIVIPFNMFFYKDEEKKLSALKRGVNKKNLKKADNTVDFKQSLYRERAGIIRWMIDNYNYLNNELSGVIPESPQCKQKKGHYIDDNDEIGLFIENFCKIDKSGELDWYERNETLANEFREFTGQHKRGERTIINDIKKHHGVLYTAVRWVSFEEGSVVVKKQKTVMNNIKLKNEKEIEQENIVEHDEQDEIPF